jgi:TPP-dependent pyruvate/acetoin dehydrogenase alpha subunit
MSSPITIDTPTAVELLRRMLRIRLTEETIAERYGEGKMRCPTHLCTGQEGVGAAVGLVLRDDDFVVSTHRAHGHYLGKGCNLKKMIAEIYGKRTGCSAGKGGSMHLVDTGAGFMGSTAIVGGTIPIAVGLGLSISLRKNPQVSCVYFGDGATEEGVFYESLNFAIIRNLPVLFICENNLYSVYSPLDVRQPRNRKIHVLASSIGVKSSFGDGNDVQMIYLMIAAAVKEIRAGGGPQFFEFATYRWREHCGPFFDNNIGYRTEKEYLSWKEKDPVERWKRLLLLNNVVTVEEIQKMEAGIISEISEAFQSSEAADFPSAEESYSGLFSE